MDATTIGIDLAKNVFQIHAADARGKTVFTKRLSRKHFLSFFANLSPCRIGMEVCGGANYWARQLQQLAHDVRQISPQFVKPYVQTNKNDYNDAQAICEAVTRPNMRFVPPKSIEQQDLQALHRIRMRLVRDRTALVNQTRGLLREYGVFLALGIHSFREQLPQVLEDAENALTPLT
ncbi:MAG: IS110 family transposase, partial [Candidatus Thiodiazotropha sp. (ex Semelilucina semeliformis)]|nr:IS110 family transposase [Candidatus Thiodiazotropha sp. (ex Semelilucina semeliformis)]